MITLWYQGRFFDGWHNTLNSEYFIETTMVNLNLDPMKCEWAQYPSNPNAHNPIKIEDTDKSIEWIVDKLVESAIVTAPGEIPQKTKDYYNVEVIEALIRVIEKQNEFLGKYFIEGKSAPGVPIQSPAKPMIIMDRMKKMVPNESDYVFKSGRRLKRYLSENENIPLPSFDSLKSIAKYLLTQKVNWNPSFLTKLNELK